jgi:NAD(P)-dependent dehydrogenase (short-subunit alcohol dehydrogenase family)
LEDTAIKHILITGANKGIGLATARAILETHKDATVLLAARDANRGKAAIASLSRDNADWASRLEFLPLDVASDESVVAARDAVIDRYGGDPAPLYGIVNNAGIGVSTDDAGAVINVNTLGTRRVCEAFIPLLKIPGRVVNVSSASGPNFVSQCTPRWQAFFQDRAVEWPAIQALIEDVLARDGDLDALRILGLGEFSAYGFSKACVTLYTMLLARRNPDLVINACTPGYIETDMTRPAAQARGAPPADLGMKPPAAGTVAILFLLFGTPRGSGHYYGSDAKRSPLDRYRAPGSPEYTGT